MQRSPVRSVSRFERKREAILDAAASLLNSHGVRGLTLGETAAAVGLSTTSITYYFPRKDGLAAACMLRGVSEVEALIDFALQASTPAKRLHRLLTLHLERVGQTVIGSAPPLSILSDRRALNLPEQTQVVSAYARMFRRLRQIFEVPELDWLTRGRRTARTHLLLELMFWASAGFPTYDAEDYPRLRDRMFEILLHGMAAEGAAWAPAPIPSTELVPDDGSDAGREAFLLAATRMINARGYRGASVEKISAELNVTKGSFYHHNDAKDDLVTACIERTFETMRRAQRLAMEIPADQWGRLASAAAALAEHQLSDHGPMLRPAALVAVPEEIRARVTEQSSRISDRFASMISDGIAEGSMRPVDPYIAAQMLRAAIHAAAQLRAWVPGVKQKAAPAVFMRPLLMGLFER